MQLQIRILLLADDPLVRAGLASSLEVDENIQVIAQFPITGFSEDLFERGQADVVLIDEGMMDEEAGQSSEPLFEDFPVLRLVDPRLSMGLAHSPTTSLISREAPQDALHAALHAVLHGWVVLDPSVIEIEPVDPGGRRADMLTEREQEVLELIAEGLTNRAISTELEISENTVKFHVNSIFTKLGAQSRTEAVVIAVRGGLLPL